MFLYSIDVFDGNNYVVCHDVSKEKFHEYFNQIKQINGVKIESVREFIGEVAFWYYAPSRRRWFPLGSIRLKSCV